MRQLCLFEDVRWNSTEAQVRSIRCTLLRAFATGLEVDAGFGQRMDAYPPEVRNLIGPMIAGLHRDRVIEIAGSCLASRPTRHGTVTRKWRAVDRGRCRQLAELDAAWLAEHQRKTGDSVAAESPAG